MTTEERARLQVVEHGLRDFVVYGHDRDEIITQLFKWADELAALLPPDEEAPRYGSEVLCEQCAIVFCPHAERGHFFHDGCPQCDA